MLKFSAQCNTKVSAGGTNPRTKIAIVNISDIFQPGIDAEAFTKLVGKVNIIGDPGG